MDLLLIKIEIIIIGNIKMVEIIYIDIQNWW